MIEQLKERFKVFEAQLNGAGKGPWHQLRTDAMDAFISKGFPSARDEEYRYTHVGRLLQKNIDFSQIATASKSGASAKKPMFHDADATHIYVNDSDQKCQKLSSLTGRQHRNHN